jgi:hypothetical protein
MRRTIPLLLLMTNCARGPTSTAPGPSPAAVAAEAEPSPDSSGCPPVESPDTAAGRRLQELVAAVNAPDAAAAEAFIETAMTAQPRERHAEFILTNAGDGLVLGLCRIDFSAGKDVVAIVGGANEHGTFEYGWLILSVNDSGKVTSLGIAPATREDLERPIEPLDDDTVRVAVEGVADGLAGYVFADKAAAMATRIRAAREAGEYAGVTNGHLLARRITEDLLAVTHDKHLDVMYGTFPPGPPSEPTAEEVEQFKKHAAQDNFGMPIAEIREGNVGYLKVFGFLPPEIAADAIAATMSKLADADVLVIDLRENGGGSPHGVALMTSYLFGKKRVHLNDLYNRRENRTESFHTSPDVPGRSFGAKKPIYVLTSAKTFSAGEEFAYNLQARKRATIVGEVTGGGAHPVDFVRVSDHWAIVLPTARAINPITKTNWEGTGVKPDVEVPAQQALDKALELAAKRKK